MGLPFAGWVGKGLLSPPPLARPTIKEADLRVVIEVILHDDVSFIKLALCTDSVYVYCGMQQSTIKLRVNGWVTAQGPLRTVDLWMIVMNLMDSTSSV